MPGLITVYLAREILKSSSATVLVLFVILISNALGRVLADIADGDIPQQALWPVMLSQSVNILSLLLPIGMFLGIVFAFGRMYKDHEIVVMNACGIGYWDFYKPVLIVLTPVLAFSVYASLVLNPEVQRKAQKIVDREENRHEFLQLKVGQFNQREGGELVFFMDSLSPDKLELQNVIISETGGDRMVLETAEAGRRKTDEKTGDLFLVLGPGERYEGNAGENDHRLIRFREHGIFLENKNKPAAAKRRLEQVPLKRLWKSKALKPRIELHWRIAIPVVLVVLCLLAVPLSYISPRQGRFGKVGYALLIYIAYLNLMALTRAQLEARTLPLELNFWWVHGLFIALALALLYRRNRGIFFDWRKPA